MLKPAIALCLALLPATAQQVPQTGTRAAAYQRVDEAVLQSMKLLEARAATVAISRNGKLLHSRGFGYKDKRERTATPPDALFRLASVTKPITAAAIRAAARAELLRFDDQAFALIGAKPRGGKWGDPRLQTITVRHLLEHRGGWDRRATFDPMFRAAEAGRALQIDRDVRPADMVVWVLGMPLQFGPGEREEYSNFGYCALGRVLEKATGAATYHAALRKLVLDPAKIADIKVGATERRDVREVYYEMSGEEPALEVLDACAGLIGSAPAVCQFLDHFWISGEPRKVGQSGDWTFFGSLNGTTTMARQRNDGHNAVVLFNRRRDHDIEADQQALKTAIDDALEPKWEKAKK